MNFTTATYRQSRQITALVDKLSKETGIEKTIILHFLHTDLERIYASKIQIHTAKLKSTEFEFNELIMKEQYLIQLLSKKIADTSNTQNRISELLTELELKEKKYSEVQFQLNELNNKLKGLNSNLSEIEKGKKQVEYKVMMKTHSIKEKSNFSFKSLIWILTGFTIIAVIIAIILILKK